MSQNWPGSVNINFFFNTESSFVNILCSSSTVYIIPVQVLFTPFILSLFKFCLLRVYFPVQVLYTQFILSLLKFCLLCILSLFQFYSLRVYFPCSSKFCLLLKYIPCSSSVYSVYIFSDPVAFRFCLYI